MDVYGSIEKRLSGTLPRRKKEKLHKTGLVMVLYLKIEYSRLSLGTDFGGLFDLGELGRKVETTVDESPH